MSARPTKRARAGPADADFGDGGNAGDGDNSVKGGVGIEAVPNEIFAGILRRVVRVLLTPDGYTRKPPRALLALRLVSRQFARGVRCLVAPRCEPFGRVVLDVHECGGASLVAKSVAVALARPSAAIIGSVASELPRRRSAASQAATAAMARFAESAESLAPFVTITLRVTIGAQPSSDAKRVRDADESPRPCDIALAQRFGAVRLHMIVPPRSGAWGTFEAWTPHQRERCRLLLRVLRAAAPRRLELDIGHCKIPMLPPDFFDGARPHVIHLNGCVFEDSANAAAAIRGCRRIIAGSAYTQRMLEGFAEAPVGPVPRERGLRASAVYGVSSECVIFAKRFTPPLYGLEMFDGAAQALPPAPADFAVMEAQRARTALAAAGRLLAGDYAPGMSRLAHFVNLVAYRGVARPLIALLDALRAIDARVLERVLSEIDLSVHSDEAAISVLFDAGAPLTHACFYACVRAGRINAELLVKFRTRTGGSVAAWMAAPCGDQQALVYAIDMNSWGAAVWLLAQAKRAGGAALAAQVMPRGGEAALDVLLDVTAYSEVRRAAMPSQERSLLHEIAIASVQMLAERHVRVSERRRLHERHRHRSKVRRLGTLDEIAWTSLEYAALCGDATVVSLLFWTARTHGVDWRQQRILLAFVVLALRSSSLKKRARAPVARLIADFIADNNVALATPLHDGKTALSLALLHGAHTQFVLLFEPAASRSW